MRCLEKRLDATIRLMERGNEMPFLSSTAFLVEALSKLVLVPRRLHDCAVVPFYTIRPCISHC